MSQIKVVTSYNRKFITQFNSQLFFSVFSVLFLLSTVLLNSIASASEINLSRSKLVQLALHLEVEDKEKQYEFSRIALLEMYDTYQYELDRSFTHLPDSVKKRAKVRHWRFATQAYLETLNEYLFLIDSGTVLSFFISKQNKIFLLIGDIPVIISGPNSGADKQIERNVVEQFCLQYDCREYFEKTHSPSKDASINNNQIKDSDEITGEWSLESNHQATFTMSNGLVFNFSNIKDRKDKEHWAIEINNELILLLNSLKRTQEKGNIIIWSSLIIEELPLTDRAYKVIINQDNDYIKLSLPFLGENPLLFNALIPWLKRYFKNKPDYRMIIIHADKYLINK